MSERNEREARVGTFRKTTNGHHQLALALTHHGVREKRKKLQEEKSVKNTSSTCSIIRKMPQKPTESDLKIWYSSISQNVRKLVVNREINSQVPLVAEPHRGDWGGYFWVTTRTLSACMHECLRQTEPTHLSNFCWISPHKWYLLEKWSGPV